MTALTSKAQTYTNGIEEVSVRHDTNTISMPARIRTDFVAVAHGRFRIVLLCNGKGASRFRTLQRPSNTSTENVT